MHRAHWMHAEQLEDEARALLLPASGKKQSRLQVFESWQQESGNPSNLAHTVWILVMYSSSCMHAQLKLVAGSPLRR